MQNLPDVSRLSSRVVRILAQNPGTMTLSGTNCYLLSHGAGPDITLVDTGSPSPSAPAFIRLLSEHLRTTGGIIRDIVLTHHHIDHVGGLESVLASIRSSGAPQPKVHKFKTPDPGSLRPSRSVVSDEDLEASVRVHSRNDSVINWLEAGDLIGAIELHGFKRLRVLHTPGHTSDSISLLLEETGELFVGDTILGTGSTVINDMGSYMHSLRQLQSQGAKVLYPGHGPHIETSEAVATKITEYIDHRLQRDAQIIQSLERNRQRSTAAELVESIYPDLPERAVLAAEQSILAHLVKLEEDGRVTSTPMLNQDGRLWSLSFEAVGQTRTPII